MSEGTAPVFEHEFWMHRCLSLAERGRGRVNPNPMVGSVLVRDGVMLAEGWHDVFGGAHAERMLFESLDSLEENGPDGGLDADFSDCILYVSLEPCSYFGKTPPCANLILERGVGKVVMGVLDPNPKVSGRGMALLRESGIEVLVGVLEAECRQLNLAFWVNQVLGRTAVVAKWAETGDGYIGLASSDDGCLARDGESLASNEISDRLMISGEASGLWVQELRWGMDAILVGVNTWNLDRPRLNVRGFEVSKQPIRIVLDRRLRGEYSAEALDRSDAPLWVIYDVNILDGDELMRAREEQFVQLSESIGLEKLVGWGLELAEVGIGQLLEWFCEAHGLGVILVEGGARVLEAFFEAGCVDEVHILRNSQMELGSGTKSPNLDRGILRRDKDLGADEHWVWKRDFGGMGIETEEGDRAE